MITKKWIRLEGRDKRHKRIRKRISGTTTAPRLCVYRSLNNLYVQLVDDVKGHTLLSVSTNDPDFRAKVDKRGNVKAAETLGGVLAVKAKQKGISKVVFDRAGYQYHGRVKALAEAARKGGLAF
jgi:large subunit ribosomal protein L18